MSEIKVDHKELEKTADTIDAYVNTHNNKMKEIDSSLVALNSTWQGNDYNELKNQWEEIEGTSSTSDKMLKSLKSYSGLLNYAANKYKNAQMNSINKASLLNRY